MAKQIGDIKLEGTIDEICFYKMEGEYYARLKSSLTGKRFWKDPAFAGSRRSSSLLGQASPMASRLYRTLPRERKNRGLFRTIVGRVKLLLKEGWEEAGVKEWFSETFFPKKKKKAKTKAAKKQKSPTRKAPVPRFQAHLLRMPYSSMNRKNNNVGIASLTDHRLPTHHLHPFRNRLQTSPTLPVATGT